MKFSLMVNLKIIILSCLVISRELYAKKCEFNIKLTQTLHNEGFHRNITYGLVLNSDDESWWIYEDCILSLDQTLPSGVFANPDELADLRRLNLVNAIPKNRINIELPAKKSEPTTVYLISKVVEDSLVLWLPVHARYHYAASGGGMVKNVIKHPKLFLRCPDRRLDACHKSIAQDVSFLCNGSSKEKCSWMEISYVALTEALIWEVPIGNTDHYYLVAFGTTLVTTVGFLYILKSIHDYNTTATRKRL